MALSAGTLFEVRSTGSDTACSGGFNPTNASMATDLAATVANTGAPVVTSASYTFQSTDIGAWLYIKSGTNWIAGWYQIASVAAGAATLTATVGAGVLASLVPSLVAGCATVASPSSGTWSVDYSQQSSAQISFTDMAIDGTTNTKFTSAGNPVGKNMIGNLVKVTSGTGFTAQTVEIVSTATTTATCDKSLGTLSSTGGNGSLGGALASPGLAAGLMVAGTDTYVRTQLLTPYQQNLTSTVNTSGSRVGLGIGVSGRPTRLIGYQTVRGDVAAFGSRPIIQVATGSGGVYAIAMTGAQSACDQIDIDANGKACNGINVSSASGGRVFRCHVSGGAAVGIQASNPVECSATGCTSFGILLVPGGAGTAVDCVAYANACSGFVGNTENAVCVGCISYGNTGASSDGFASGGSMFGYSCTAYGNGRDGFRLGTVSASYHLQNCVSYGNAAYGYGSGAAATVGARIRNCAGGGNTTADYAVGSLFVVTGFVSLTASPFTNAASGDFSLNNTAGAGALLRAAAAPGVFPAGLTTGYADIGAVQHADPVGGGGYVPVLIE